MKTIDIHGRPIVNKHQALEIMAKEEAEFDALDALDALDDHWDDFDYVDVDWLEPMPSPSRSR